GVEYDVGGAPAALDKIEEFIHDEDVMVTVAVCDSITELWETEWAALTAPARLLQWIAEGRETEQYTARLAFLVAGLELVLRLPGDDFDWPGLLHIAATDARRRDEIAALWRNVLTDPLLQEDAERVLYEWADMADRATTVRRWLARLAVAIAA